MDFPELQGLDIELRIFKRSGRLGRSEIEFDGFRCDAGVAQLNITEEDLDGNPQGPGFGALGRGPRGGGGDVEIEPIDMNTLEMKGWTRIEGDGPAGVNGRERELNVVVGELERVEVQPPPEGALGDGDRKAGDKSRQATAEPARAGGGGEQIDRARRQDQADEDRPGQQAAHAAAAGGFGFGGVHRSVPMEKWTRKGGSDSLTPQAKSSRSGASGDSQRRPNPVPSANPSAKRRSAEALPIS